MQTLNVKTIFVILISLATVFFLQSCSKESIDTNVQTETLHYSLTSPTGLVLATDLEDLATILNKESHLDIQNAELEITAINYDENENASFALIEYMVDSENKSAIVLLNVSKKKAIYKKDKDIYVGDINLDDKNLVFSGDSFNSSKRVLAAATFVCCGSSCCHWHYTGGNTFSCNCHSSGSCHIH